MPTHVLAQNNSGKFSRVLAGEPTQFDAWCFDDEAFAIIKAKVEFSDEKCTIRLDKALEEQGAKYSLEIGNLLTRIDNIKNEYDSILKIKNREIEQLEITALERPNDYTVWWATGGFAAGALTSILIFMAVSK